MRWIIRLMGLVVLMIVVAVVLVLMLPGERIAKIAADKIGSMTGRAVTMQGDTRVSFYPVLGIATGPVTIANADWAGDTPMFQADSLKIGVEPQALFGGDIRITGLEAIAPAINLRRAADGRVNWELGVEGVAPSGQSDGTTPGRSDWLALTLDRALIRNAAVTFVDDIKGTRTEMTGMDFDLRWPDYEGTATFDAVLRPAGDEVKVSGQLERVGHFIAGGVSDFAATLSSGAGKATFSGRAGAAPEAAGRLSVKVGDTAAFLAALGLGTVDVPRGLGRSIALDGELSVTHDMRLSLRDMALQLDQNQLTGAADVLLGGERPRANVQLRAGALDLADLGGGGGGNGQGPAGGGWSTSPIDASGLAPIDGEFALVADSVDLGNLKLGKTRTLATLERSRLVFELREVRAYDGLVTGEFVVNNRSGLSVGGKLAAEAISLEHFLTDTMDLTRFSGAANGEVQFLGAGQSMHAIMNSLDGSGAISMGRGVISGIDLDKLMRSGDVSGGTTVFDSLSATFTIDRGNLFNQDLLMLLPLVRATGSGRIGLGARDIDYLFTPSLLEGENRTGLAIPVAIEGPWAKPRIKPDLEKAIDLNFKEEKKELKAKAEEEVGRALEKELGVTPQEGQSVEDAVRDKIEDKAKKQLFKLFD